MDHRSLSHQWISSLKYTNFFSSYTLLIVAGALGVLLSIFLKVFLLQLFPFFGQWLTTPNFSVRDYSWRQQLVVLRIIM